MGGSAPTVFGSIAVVRLMMKGWARFKQVTESSKTSPPPDPPSPPPDLNPAS